MKYANQFLNAQGDRSTPTFLENRSKAIKAIVALVPAARNAAETDEIREALVNDNVLRLKFQGQNGRGFV